MSSKTNTTAAKEEAMPALVPKLRFPEFRGGDGWTEKPLKAAAHINPPNGGQPELFVYIDLESVDAGELKAKERISRVGAPSRAQRLVERGDIIYQVVRPYQRNNLLCEFDDDENYVASTGYAQLRAKGSNRFLYQSIHTDSFVGRVIAKCTGSNYPAINSSDLADIHLPIPPTLLEQQKIAECLSSVDELMAAQARKVDALKTHKKGLMQQLFPREGETHPRLRFSEFHNTGEWETRELSDFITERNEYPKEKVPLFSLTIEDGVTPKTERYERSFLVNDEADAYKLVMPDDFAFNPMNLRFGAIGRHSGIDKVAVSKYYNIFSCDKTVDSRFCEMYFRSDRMVAFYDDRAIGSLIEKRRVHFAAFLKFDIRFPRLPEQQRIATCLTSLDALITAETQKLEALKTHKNGLMQQLFPSPETEA
jgi:type I restriction enzyme S subunit